MQYSVSFRGKLIFIVASTQKKVRQCSISPCTNVCPFSLQHSACCCTRRGLTRCRRISWCHVEKVQKTTLVPLAHTLSSYGSQWREFPSCHEQTLGSSQLTAKLMAIKVKSYTGNCKLVWIHNQEVYPEYIRKQFQEKKNTITAVSHKYAPPPCTLAPALLAQVPTKIFFSCISPPPSPARKCSHKPIK